MTDHIARIESASREIRRLERDLAEHPCGARADALRSALAWMQSERAILYAVAHRLSSASVHPARIETEWARADSPGGVWRERLWRVFHPARTAAWLSHDEAERIGAAERRAAALQAARDNDRAPMLAGPLG